MFNPQINSIISEVDALRHTVDDHWQIPADEALVIAQLARLGRCRSICEIGTSYGFSTLHLAAATAELGGHVHTFDIEPRKTAAARDHLTRAGVINSVTLHTGPAQQLLPTLKPAAPFDFVFIDAWKDQSPQYLAAVTPHLAPRAVLITDNTTTHASELADFIKQLRALPGAKSCDVPVGNGFELTILG